MTSGALAQITGVTGRRLLRIPFGIGAARQSQAQPPADRGKQAG